MAGAEAALDGAAAAALAGGAEIQAWAQISVLMSVQIRVLTSVPASARWTAGKEIIGIGSALGKNAGRHTCRDPGVLFVRLVHGKVGVNVYAPLLWREHFHLSE